MDSTTKDEKGPEPDVIQAELVQVAPGTPWGWQPVRPPRPRRRRWRLPILLFAATCLTTLLAGKEMAGEDVPWLAGIVYGLRYAAPLMTILICHEMGHFLQAHRNGVYASLPYFIPFPPPSPIGTLGAVIAMEPRVGGRRALFDIGITGPLAGLVPTFVFCIWGLHLSAVKHATTGLPLGSPLLFDLLARLKFGIPPRGYDVALDPMAFAGWVGLLITSLNLIPIGQLDGGHVLYALLRKKAHRVATAILFAALFLVVWYRLWPWTIMLVLLFMMGPIHPPTADDNEPLGIVRVVLGWLTLAFIIVGFTPTPFGR